MTVYTYRLDRWLTLLPPPSIRGGNNWVLSGPSNVPHRAKRSTRSVCKLFFVPLNLIIVLSLETSNWYQNKIKTKTTTRFCKVFKNFYCLVILNIPISIYIILGLAYDKSLRPSIQRSTKQLTGRSTSFAYQTLTPKASTLVSACHQGHQGSVRWSAWALQSILHRRGKERKKSDIDQSKNRAWVSSRKGFPLRLHHWNGLMMRPFLMEELKWDDWMVFADVVDLTSPLIFKFPFFFGL